MRNRPTIRQLREPTLLRGYSGNLAGNAKLTPESIARSLSGRRFRVDIGNNFAASPRFYEETATSFLDQCGADNSTGLNLPMIPFNELPQDTALELALPGLEQSYFKCDKFLFISTTNSYTGLHFDTADNLFLQVYGMKRFRLACPSATPNMYMTKKYERGSRFSAADGRVKFDADRFPQMALVHFIEITLSQGDVLFVPKNWWHSVETLSPSVSVASFCMGRISYLRSRIYEGCIEGLHRMNLYGKNCNCCSK